MYPPFFVARSTEKQSIQDKLGDCLMKPSTLAGVTRSLNCAAFRVLRKSTSFACGEGTSWPNTNARLPSLATNETEGFLLAPAVDRTTPKPSNVALPPTSVMPCWRSPSFQVPVLPASKFTFSSYEADTFSATYQNANAWSSCPGWPWLSLLTRNWKMTSKSFVNTGHLFQAKPESCGTPGCTRSRSRSKIEAPLTIQSLSKLSYSNGVEKEWRGM
mmetsp:Transcript_48607/g.141623  ORF Transcript_48607/g.141623 Transcript_48607/m.141623 type:complete len:216 (+) Transcript_48607:988-1635(+)